MRIFMQSIGSGDEVPHYCQLLLHRDMFGGWTVIRETGRQGGRRYVRKQHAGEHDGAVDLLLDWRDQQLRKGYRVVFFEGEGPESR